MPKPPIDNGGQAYPHHTIAKYGSYVPEAGMTMRDYFAGQALTGLLSSWWGIIYKMCPSWASKESYIQADKMLKERTYDIIS